jgi:tetraacyldisaccharide 4'-kinase
MKKHFRIQDIFLFPLSLIYGIAVWIRNRLFDYRFLLKSKEFHLPVISVGNIYVGGTGKTPHIEYMVRLLKDEFRVATLSRGYKRKTKGFILAKVNSTSDEIGDEPRQIKLKFPDIKVVVDADRVEGINRLLQLEKNIDVILLDDAFQHRYVMPNISILLVDYEHPLQNDALLPYGRLREQAFERRRADIIVVSKCPEDIKPIDQRLIEKYLKKRSYQKVFFTTLKYLEPLPVFSDFAKALSFSEIKSKMPVVFLLTGIANARPLKEYLLTATSEIREINYPDHYAFSVKDLRNVIEIYSAETGMDKFIITTEKDAMRLQQFPDLDEELKQAMYYVPVRVEFFENEEKDFNSYITNYVRNNKPDNILYQATDKKRT